MENDITKIIIGTIKKIKIYDENENTSNQNSVLQNSFLSIKIDEGPIIIILESRDINFKIDNYHRMAIGRIICT